MGRDAVRMTPDEVADFLAFQLKVQVASNGPDGMPHLTTLFYVLDAGRIAFWTYARSQKVRNLDRDPRMACLVESGDEYAELRGASLTGTAEIIRDTAAVRDLGSRVVSRMAGVASIEDLGEAGLAEVERQAAKRVGSSYEPRTSPAGTTPSCSAEVTHTRNSFPVPYGEEPLACASPCCRTAANPIAGARASTSGTSAVS